MKSEAEKMAMREYHRKWRAENPDKVRGCQVRFWKKRVRELEAAGE